MDRPARGGWSFCRVVTYFKTSAISDQYGGCINSGTIHSKNKPRTPPTKYVFRPGLEKQKSWKYTGNTGDRTLLDVETRFVHLRNGCDGRLFPVQKIPKCRRARVGNRGAEGSSSSLGSDWVSGSGRAGYCLCTGRERRAAKSSKDFFVRLSSFTLGGNASGAETTRSGLHTQWWAQMNRTWHRSCDVVQGPRWHAQGYGCTG